MENRASEVTRLDYDTDSLTSYGLTTSSLASERVKQTHFAY